MLNLGLTAAEQRAFEVALRDHHSIRVDVDVLNMNGEHLARLDPATVDGQVNVDATAAVTRSLTLTVFDPNRSLNFDSNSPDDGALYLDRMIRVTYGVKVPVVGWVEVPVFTGPVTSLDRSSDLLNVECQGKESLASTPVWLPLSLKKGHLKTNAIRTILAERAGESRFDLPDFVARLPHTLSLGRQSVAWVEASRLAASMDRQLFYDGRGVCRLRNLPGNVFTFRTGDGGTVTGAPQVSYSTEDVRNTVWVKGGKPRGSKTDTNPDTPAPRHVADVQATAVARRDHALSPWRLGRNGVPRYLVEFVTNTHIRSGAEARKVANRRLDDLLTEAVSVTLEALPVPHLEELDRVRVATDEAVFSMRLKQFSLPLKVGSSMSVGFNQRVSVRRGRVRR